MYEKGKGVRGKRDGRNDSRRESIICILSVYFSVLNQSNELKAMAHRLK